ncbi:hypothetical protein [Reyranella sp.]|uniref:hypothetical protein n=1 Tax=Reyranella sp. TaxID=1929291 RepID=UPI0026003461|nr:hypothetical protein [Reyranella sp.]
MATQEDDVLREEALARALAGGAARLTDFAWVWASTGDGASDAPRKRMLTATQEKPTAIRLRGKIIANTPHAKSDSYAHPIGYERLLELY